MSDLNTQEIDTLLGRIETAVWALRDRDPSHNLLITEILESVNGLRTLLEVPRSS